MRVLILAENVLLRAGLERVLAGKQLEVVAALATTDELPPAEVAFVVLYESRDLQALEALKAAAPELAIVAVGMDEDPDRVLQALLCGASCYLSVEAPPQSLHVAARAAAQGYVMAPQASLRRACAGLALPTAGEEPLTPREREVLQLVSHGLTNAEIAARLVVSPGTVRTHVSNILGKLGLADRVQAAVWASEHGLAQPLPFELVELAD